MRTEYDFSKGKRGKFYYRDADPVMAPAGEEPDWAGVDGPLGKFIDDQASQTLKSYRAQRHLISEHANQEHSMAHGGYARRQLYELVQNSADALREAPDGQGSILVRLTERYLYCADNGKPIDEDGVVGLMFACLSTKTNTPAIGMHGLGFKSVLGVSDAPQFYSRSGSFVFDRQRAEQRIARICRSERYPVLRLPEPIDPHAARNEDDELRELMTWASNIVCLPIKTAAHADLARQIKEFPAEFLLLADHVRYLTLECGELTREVLLQERDGELHLVTGDGVSRWQRFDTTCRISSEARQDCPDRGGIEDAPIRWAVPLDRLERPGHFWAYFPTRTASLVAGILNAHWKTNNDRQNLLDGAYNDELIVASAKLIADSLSCLATPADPARHLDALPRGEASGDSEQSKRLRSLLLEHLCKQKVVPDQDGVLRGITGISYAPGELTDLSDTEPLQRWAAYSDRPRYWLHHKALNRNRLAQIDRLFLHLPKCEYVSYLKSIDHVEYRLSTGHAQTVVRADISVWLEALFSGDKADDVQASMAAVQAAAEIPTRIRLQKRLGNIVLTTSGDRCPPDPEVVFLPDSALSDECSTGTVAYVHPRLMSDTLTRSALNKLGFELPSPETAFGRIAT